MSHHSPAGRVPRGELFADPSARAVWAALCALDPASQHDVLAELQRRLGAPVLASSDARTRRAIAALREAAEILGRSPSVADYRRLLAERRELDWPPDGSLRKWLGGSWNDCLARAHLEAVADGDVLVAQLGPGLDGQEVIDALRACAKELGHVPSYTEYLGWSRRPDVRSRRGRRPRSLSPFTRSFGGFADSLIASGLVDGHTAAAMPKTTQVRYRRYSVDTNAVIEAIREVAARLGHSPRTVEYDREQALIRSESEADGKLRILPARSTIQGHFRTWDDALVAAGLQPLGGRATGGGGKKNRGRKAPRVTEQAILEALRAAYAELGAPFRSPAYKRWCRQEAERNRAAGLKDVPPSLYTIRSRYGTWENALQAALREDSGTAAGEIEHATPSTSNADDPSTGQAA